MDLNDADLAKTLECPVCLDVFDEPKLLICGHTVCQKCVNKVVAMRRNAANARQGRNPNCIKCPVCTTETEIPPDGLTTNYSLVDLVCRAQKSLVDSYACNGCGQLAPVAKMYTCETCQEALKCKPLWICAVCAMEQHRSHTTSKCNKATRWQIEEACQGIGSTGLVADAYAGVTVSHLNRAMRETELITQLLNQQKRGFVRLEARLKRSDNDLAQDGLAASLQQATALKQKFEQASIFASQAGKDVESAVRDCREKIEDLFPMDEDEPVETEDGESLRNNFDLRVFDDGEEAIELRSCRIDEVPDLSRFTELQFLGFRWNLLSSINEKLIHTTLTWLDLYDNRLTEIRGLDALVNLESLNVSFNRLSKIQGLTRLVKLKSIYLMHNGIRKIEGLDNQHKLRELYLERNRIRRIENISHLSKLNLLSIEGTRVTKLENLDMLANLEELYVAELGLETFDGIENLSKLKRIDGARNSITSLDHLGHLHQLERLLLNDNKISQWPEVDKLVKLERLRIVRLEGNPIQALDRDGYRRKVTHALQQVAELDDAPCS